MPKHACYGSKKLAFNTLSSGRVKMVCFSVIAVFAVVFYVLAIRTTFQVSHTFSPYYVDDLVARERFELSSMAPKATMLGHYTTGLRHMLVCVVLKF